MNMSTSTRTKISNGSILSTYVKKGQQGALSCRATVILNKSSCIGGGGHLDILRLIN